MSAESIIEATLGEFPVFEYARGNTSALTFSENVWQISKDDSVRYGLSWAAPPYGGTAAENEAKARRYEHFFVFSTLTEVANSWDSAVLREARRTHESVSRDIRGALQAALGPDKAGAFYMVSSGCAACESCTCPDAPCRCPGERLPSLESHGIVLLSLAEELGLSLNLGEDVVVFFTMIFYND